MRHLGRHTAGFWAASLLLVTAIGGLPADCQTGFADHEGPLACSASSSLGEPFHQRPDFDVRVAFRGQPVTGVKVVLSEESAGRAVIATRHTDLEGVAHFSAIPAGIYKTHIDGALLSPSQEIEVATLETNAANVSIEWPWSPAVTRRVRGWVMDWEKDTPQNRLERRPFARALVQLLDLRSGRLLASTHTSPDGYYGFEVPHDGLYVVRLSEAHDPSTTAYDKAVEVSSEAFRDLMPRLEVDHVCGGGLVELPDSIDPPDVLVAARAAAGAASR